MASLDHTLKGIFDTNHVAVLGHKRAAPFKAQYGKISVKLVDPTKIRDSSLANEEFTDYAVHANLPELVPKDQIWVGRNIDPKERAILVHTGLQEIRALNRGLSKGKAYDNAMLYQRHLRERANSYAPKGNVAVKADPAVYIEKIGKTGEPVMQVWLVSGDKVRDRYKADFVESGQCAEDLFIPEGQIWVERDVPEKERPFVTAHEYFEYRLMDDKHMKYGPAHDLASKVEFHYREMGAAPSLGELSKTWVEKMLREIGAR